MTFLSEWYNMNSMRSILLGFLMLVMLTPSLACAAFVHADSQKQVKSEQHIPCHGEKSDTDEDLPLMTFKDCSGVDLAQADYNPAAKKPDVQTDKVFFAWADIVPTHGFSLYPVRTSWTDNGILLR